MAKFQRETATRVEDLPHRFEEHELEGDCQVCMSAAGDPRHQAWEQAQVSQREQAQAQFGREIGS